MEWLSSRIDGVALALFGAGWAVLTVPESIVMHPFRIAVVCWVAAVLLFVSGFPIVQRRLRFLRNELFFFYRRTARSRPWGAPVGVGLVIMVLVMLFFWGGRWLLEPQEDSELAAGPQLFVESDREFFTIPQEDQPIPPKVSRFARVKVTNRGATSVANVKAAVIRMNNRDWSFQLPLSSSDTWFIIPKPSLAVSTTLNPGDDQYFDVLVECNGPPSCPRGSVVIPHIESGMRKLGAPPNAKLYEVTVRVSGDGVSAVTKTFAIS